MALGNIVTAWAMPIFGILWTSLVTYRFIIQGVAMTWLRDNLEIINSVNESADLAQSVDDVGEVYFVPAFSGLYAPYWRKDARRYVSFFLNFY